MASALLVVQVQSPLPLKSARERLHHLLQFVLVPVRRSECSVFGRAPLLLALDLPYLKDPGMEWRPSRGADGDDSPVEFRDCIVRNSKIFLLGYQCIEPHDGPAAVCAPYSTCS
ncbi:hypothetical protein R1sor_021691 [Riccia sorocarpa]|uniref:Uncharacterized protein n=1 Tax=Riccia sorocarpa TaxID=122646 RepID=A0ABD3GHR2_9MARC